MSTQSVSSQDRSLHHSSLHHSSRHENVLTGSRLGHLLRPWLIETVMEWRRRMQSRRELATLSEIELRDIGYPARAEAEKAKPFWRA
jgi:uncharacterized protein YjiS (DUF1127 family)